jgi:Stress responsive A/B Barrel Domain
MDRRSFLTTTALAAPAIFAVANQINMPGTDILTEKNIFVHHVYFWLKNPGSQEDKRKLIEGLKKLTKVKTIKTFHIGQPADTNREVIDSSYAISWLVIFKNKAGQDSYQTDPIHLKFVEECSGLWSKVTVYDSVDV